MLERVFGGATGECPLISFVKNYRGYLCWKDVPQHIRQVIHEHEVALATIHLKPGDWRPGAYEKLTEEERETIDKAWKIMERLQIKENEELQPEKIH